MNTKKKLLTLMIASSHAIMTPVTYADTSIAGHASKVAQYGTPVRYDIREDLKKQLISFSRLPENWDGYGAVKPYEEVIANAVSFLYQLPDAYADELTMDGLSLAPHGTVVIDWRRTDDALVSVEIGKDNLAFFSEIPDTDSPSVDFVPLFDHLQITQALDLLYRTNRVS